MPASAARPRIILCFEQVHGIRATTRKNGDNLRITQKKKKKKTLETFKNRYGWKCICTQNFIVQRNKLCPDHTPIHHTVDQ